MFTPRWSAVKWFWLSPVGAMCSFSTVCPAPLLSSHSSPAPSAAYFCANGGSDQTSTIQPPTQRSLSAPRCVNYSGNGSLVRRSSSSSTPLLSTSSVSKVQPFLPLSLRSFAGEDLTLDLFHPLRVFDYSALIFSETTLKVILMQRNMLLGVNSI